jgi:hypothetical protein
MLSAPCASVFEFRLPSWYAAATYASKARFFLGLRDIFGVYATTLVGGAGPVICNGGLYSLKAPAKNSVHFLGHAAVGWLVDLHD